jgi:hypothetical protein
MGDVSDPVDGVLDRPVTLGATGSLEQVAAAAVSDEVQFWAHTVNDRHSGL